MKITAILFSTLLILILLSTCYYDSQEYLFHKISQCDTIGTIHFTSVDTVLQSNCVGCHNKSSTVNLDGYKYVHPYAVDFTVNPLIPKLQGVIRRHSGFKPMPPDAALDTCSIRKIEIWIEQGALDN
jgi:uncharacterized membrane protein